ncbi:MAG TPA: NAD+ synthase [Acidimicrobiales bacterium]|nr:NAD+ synthase [Acidimicrobiales bacterium]
MPPLRLAAAQINTVVGDLDGNVRRILDALGEAGRMGADLCVLPELAVTGYPPEDLLLKSGFVADNVAALQAVAAATGDCVAVVGFVDPLGRPPGRTGSGPYGTLPVSPLANAAAVCAAGRVVGVYHKRLLPNYGVFDEVRWFTPGQEPPALYAVGDALVGVSVCEDVWSADGPVPVMGRGGADVVVNLNASPYSQGRRAERLAMLRQRVAQSGCAVAYVNQVGGQDELVFDGASLVLAADGSLLAGGVQFAEDLVVVDLPVGRRTDHVPAADRGAGGRPGLAVVEVPVGAPPARRPRPAVAPAVPEPLPGDAEVYEALVLGTRDYLAKNGFTDAIVGLSGGIDSSLVATVAVDAVGAGRVHGLSMPSRYSSAGSRTDAEQLADRLGIDLRVVPIERAHVALAALLEPVLDGPPTGLTDENLQSRLRGLLLMAVSNARGFIVLTTGNKSEMATGYSTLYGDSAGGFAVIKDVPKTLVYELCRYRNRKAAAAGRPEPIPREVLEKPPSAELRPGQRDDQSLPPYDLLDPVLQAYVERDRTAADLVADGFDPAVVDRVVRLVDGAEYKRRQMPPGVRITTKAFGKDRRMPITNRYRPARPVAAPVAAGG